MTPIGHVVSPVAEPRDDDWGHVRSEIHPDTAPARGLRGMEHFSHILVIFLMHQSTFDPDAHLVRRPQGRTDMPEVGISAQRAKHRPNPIGVTAVQLIGVEGNVLRVRDLDDINGTPILDVKPYVPLFDRVENPLLPEWIGRLTEGYF
jgi:tRNA-Thr(GGU) m(6)t(6)A37 methyltransferase TsaA